MVGSGAELVGGVLGAGGRGMPGTVRPDPSTLGAVGERGSHREGYGRVPTPGWSLRIARASAVEDNVTRCEGRSATSVATIFNQSVDSGLAGIVGWPCSTNRLDTRRWRHGSGRSALPGVLGTG
jgi:hypothetical protein